MQRLLFAFALVFMTTATTALAQSVEVATNPGIAESFSKPVPLGDASRLALLYDNGPLVTNPGAGAGGADASAIQAQYGSTLFGSQHNPAAAPPAGPFYVADDFTVPAGGWTIDDIDLFSYQTGGNPTTSTFTGVFVQILNGPPNDPASTVVFGDLTTNRLATSTFSGIYRVTQTTLTNNQRPIFRNNVTIGTTLPAGTYWMQWGSTGSLASGPWVPPVSVAGATTPPPGNALQFANGAWQAAQDNTPPAPGPPFAIDFPFVINGTAGTPTGPVLGVSPSTVAFGNMTTGMDSTRTITLTNNGTGTLTISSVAYTGDAGVTITQPGSLTLAAGASTTFTVTFAPTTPGAVTGTITVTSNAAGSPTTIAVSGTGVAPSTAITYPSTDTPLVIPDNTTAGGPGSVTSTLVIPASETRLIQDLDVDLNITHTFIGDLAVTLAKGALTSSVMDRPGRVDTGFGCGGDNPNIIADDEGTDGSIEGSCTTTGYPVLDGRYTPNTPLTVFDTAPIAGTYTLTVTDNANGDTGSLASWALLITPQGSIAGEGSPDAVASLTVAPNPVAAQGQVSLTVPSTQDVRVALYDALGREVMTLLDRSVASDQTAYIAFSTQNLPAGIYVVRAMGTDLALTQRVTVVR